MNKSLKIFLIFLTFLPIIILIVLLIKYSVNFPFWDEWEIPTLIEKISTGKLLFSDLIAQHNEHRIFFPRIIFLADFYLTKWNIKYEMILSLFLAVAHFIFIIFFMYKIQQNIYHKYKYYFVPIISLIIFSLNQFENWFMGWQIQIFLNVFCVSLGFLLLGLFKIKKRNYFFAILLGVISTFSFANGLLFWILGFMILVLNQKHLSHKNIYFISWMSISLLIYLIYFIGFHKAPGIPSYVLSISNIGYFFRYVLVYIGGSFGINSGVQAWCFGIINIIGIIYLSKVLFKKHRSFVVVCWGIWGYAIFSAILTAFGRFGFNNEGATSRYVTIANLAWISFMILLFMYLSERENRRIAVYSMAFLYLIVYLVHILDFEFNVGQIFRHFETLSNTKQSISCSKDIEQKTYETIYPKSETVKARIDYLKQNYSLVFEKEKCFSNTDR